MSRRRSAFVYCPSLAEREYSPHHPFKPQRARLTMEMCRRRGYLERPWMEVLTPPPAAPDVLELVHDPQYLEVLRAASVGEIDERTLRHGLGMEECPVFPGLWAYCLESVGAVLGGLGALLDDRADLVFSPAGGMHHALPDMATGFCYVNDVALACRIAADRGLRVAYLDVDAHHANGVQKVFWADDRVLMVSLHETGRTLYPWIGFTTELGEGKGLGYNLNLPLEPDTDDTTFLHTLRHGALPAIRAFAPDLLIVELGADGLAVDPLTHLRFTNNGLADVAELLPALAPKVLVTGGGGYDVAATTKAWTLAWSTMNGIEPIADAYAMMGGVFLGEEQLQDGTLRDMNLYMSGPDLVRVREAADKAIADMRRNVLPVLERAAALRAAGGTDPAGGAAA